MCQTNTGRPHSCHDKSLQPPPGGRSTWQGRGGRDLFCLGPFCEKFDMKWAQNNGRRTFVRRPATLKGFYFARSGNHERYWPNAAQQSGSIRWIAPSPRRDTPAFDQQQHPVCDQYKPYCPVTLDVPRINPDKLLRERIFTYQKMRQWACK
jgi:hypothetical protein